MLTHGSTATAVSTRELAWNLAGTGFDNGETLTEDSMTAEQALGQAGMLGWNVRKVPLVTGGDPAKILAGDSDLHVPEKFATVRDSDSGPKVLGVVGSRFSVFQNEGTVDLLNAIVDEGGAHFEAAGFYGNGAKTFTVMKLPEGIVIGGEDAHDLYMVVANAHDGTGSLQVWVTALRLRCTNMLTASLRSAKSRWSLRHTASLNGKVQEARESLKLTWKWAEEFQAQSEILLSTPFSEAEFQAMVDDLAPASTSEREGWVARQEEKRTALVNLFRSADTNEIGRGTRWAAYNAFTEYADWYLPVKGDDDGSRRAVRQLDSTTQVAFKQHAWDVLVLN